MMLSLCDILFVVFRFVSFHCVLFVLCFRLSCVVCVWCGVLCMLCRFVLVLVFDMFGVVLLCFCAVLYCVVVLCCVVCVDLVPCGSFRVVFVWFVECALRLVSCVCVCVVLLCCVCCCVCVVLCCCWCMCCLLCVVAFCLLLWFVFCCACLCCVEVMCFVLVC